MNILFEDGEALVIDKPAGLPVDPPRAGGVSLSDRLGELKLGFLREPVPVHRLDRDTSGCLLLARNPKAVKRFAAAFEQRLPEKHYLGIVRGTPEEESGVIDAPLVKTSTRETGWRMVIADGGKPSVTHWKVAARAGDLTLLAFRLETGRTHQIRVHVADDLGLPLLGDPVYGSLEGAPRTMLHASRFVMPREGKATVDATAPLPADFAVLGFS